MLLKKKKSIQLYTVHWPKPCLARRPARTRSLARRCHCATYQPNGPRPISSRAHTPAQCAAAALLFSRASFFLSGAAYFYGPAGLVRQKGPRPSLKCHARRTQAVTWVSRKLLRASLPRAWLRHEEIWSIKIDPTADLDSRSNKTGLQPKP